MNLAILRLEGSDAALDTAVAALGLPVATRWKRGDPKRRGGGHAQSGLQATISDGPRSDDVVRELRAFLERIQAQPLRVSSLQLAATIAIGVTAGSPDQFVAHVALNATDLEAIAAAGMDLTFSAYPATDETDVAESDEPAADERSSSAIDCANPPRGG
jgi:hypothetical protein